ncbi:hypothetical protein FE257_006668 [Aspergillus nanangensis]|uniref:UbiA prenyltransferase family-domain-containing protein n=1 Tax=Aspergillus nanangensis TaxID=2582783 RepID=A0AAD4CPF2_ASPNN|nr:hypothetical protein FE257_006668 [Aspergillus nanangensis]
MAIIFLLALYRELIITGRMLRSNTGASFFVWMFGTAGRLLTLDPKPSPHTLALIITESLLDCFLFAYTFDILNQITSVEEDTLNKPYRPIPAGLLSIRGAKWRLILSWIGCYPVIWIVSGKEATFIQFTWKLWTLFCYVWPRINHWFFRNTFAGIGTYMMYRWINIIVTNHVPNAEMWYGYDLLFALFVNTTCQLQEFHDVDGDRKAGRRTLAVILGPTGRTVLRRGTTALMVVYGVAGCAWAVACQSVVATSRTPLMVGLVYTLTCGVILCRMWNSHSKAYDETTYKFGYIAASCLMSLYLRLVGSMDGK